MDIPAKGSVSFSLPPTIRQSLGDVAIASARIDALLAEFLSYLLQADPGSMYVLNQDIASGTQLKWIRTLASGRFTNENTLTNLAVLFDRIATTKAERNALVHGVWSPGPEPGTAIVQTVKMDRAEWIREELVTSADLDDLFRDLESIGDELHAIGVRLGFLS
jgi:hypothetical protein